MPSPAEYADHWLEQAVGPSAGKDPFMRFMTVWVGFNALYAHESRTVDGDRNQVREFAKDVRLLQMHAMLLDLTNLPAYRSAIHALAEHGVKNLQKDYRVSIGRDFPLKEVLECVYQVRCNCFHGGKHKADKRDRDLVTASFVIIANLLSTTSAATWSVAGSISWTRYREQNNGDIGRSDTPFFRPKLTRRLPRKAGPHRALR